MIALRQILCPVDFSDASSRALDQASALARWHEAQIAVVYVHPLAAIPPAEMPYLPGTNPLTARERETALVSLRRLVERIRQTGTPVQIAVDEGNAAVEIVARADRLGAELIVMGTHGRHGLERLMLGSVAEQVLRTAPCPVLTVSPRSESAARGTFRRILCPLDLLDTSTATAAQAFALAQDTGAEVLLLHILDGRTFPPSRTPFRFDLGEFRSDVEGYARADLRRLVPDDASGWCQPELLVKWGRRPHREILAVAEARGADLIVMGARGSALGQAVFGSTAQEIVRAARCPVLTVRPPSRHADHDQPELIGAVAGGDSTRSPER